MSDSTELSSNEEVGACPSGLGKPLVDIESGDKCLPVTKGQEGLKRLAVAGETPKKSDAMEAISAFGPISAMVRSLLNVKNSAENFSPSFNLSKIKQLVVDINNELASINENLNAIKKTNIRIGEKLADDILSKLSYARREIAYYISKTRDDGFWGSLIGGAAALYGEEILDQIDGTDEYIARLQRVIPSITDTSIATVTNNAVLNKMLPAEIG